MWKNYLKKSHKSVNQFSVNLHKRYASFSCARVNYTAHAHFFSPPELVRVMKTTTDYEKLEEFTHIARLYIYNIFYFSKTITHNSASGMVVIYGKCSFFHCGLQYTKKAEHWL